MRTDKKVGFLITGLIMLAGLAAWTIQLKEGLVLTHMRNSYTWGLYVSTLAFFVGNAAGGLVLVARNSINSSWLCLQRGARWLTGVGEPYNSVECGVRLIGSEFALHDVFADGIYFASKPLCCILYYRWNVEILKGFMQALRRTL